MTLGPLGNLIRQIKHSVKFGSFVCAIIVHRLLFFFDYHGI